MLRIRMYVVCTLVRIVMASTQLFREIHSLFMRKIECAVTIGHIKAVCDCLAHAGEVIFQKKELLKVLSLPGLSTPV